ncbi:cobaltochelatase subunit CobN [Paucibacter sp. O1-1]|nr:cobaltochelatase subunit CobN [Paucibacter sp. O1-1]MDA3825984.1 cobaltochelatase subunit CobN [Paucibacter sp. O1-1]
MCRELDAREDFKERLSRGEVALHNRDNREHDIFDSDDYLQFHGGMIRHDPQPQRAASPSIISAIHMIRRDRLCGI